MALDSSNWQTPFHEAKAACTSLHMQGRSRREHSGVRERALMLHCTAVRTVLLQYVASNIKLSIVCYLQCDGPG